MDGIVIFTKNAMRQGRGIDRIDFTCTLAYIMYLYYLFISLITRTRVVSKNLSYLSFCDAAYQFFEQINMRRCKNVSDNQGTP